MEQQKILDLIKDYQDQLEDCDALYCFDLGDDGAVRLDTTKSPPDVQFFETADGVDADCTIQISFANLQKLMAGKLNPMLAFSLGKLKIRGNTGLAMKLAKALDS